MYIARILYPVKVLGPGNRIGIWMAGCEHCCKGCSNPELWSQERKYKTDLDMVKTLISSVVRSHHVDGFTITGGDPLYQPEALEKLLAELNAICKDILVYTGYQYSEIEKKYPQILKQIAVLIDGKYVERQNTGAILMGSDNQKMYYLRQEFKPVYEDYLKQPHNLIQNFAAKDGIISVGIHFSGFEKELKEKAAKKGLEEKKDG